MTGDPRRKSIGDLKREPVEQPQYRSVRKTLFAAFAVVAALLAVCVILVLIISELR
jgi:hypothetical protein